LALILGCARKQVNERNLHESVWNAALEVLIGIGT
jgi:hypothetical protein